MVWSTEFPKPTCAVKDCGLPIKGYGYCNKHYQLFKRHGSPEKLVKTARQHPLYIVWFEKKQNKRLCEEWLTFKTFCDAIGERPEGNFVLKRLDETKPYGPDNWQWYEQLKKQEDKTDKNWYARKWKNARERNPDIEYGRNLERRFGLSLEQYLEKLKIQNFVCAICEQPEKLIITATGLSKRLAVDHCHKSEKIRELLCNRCNTSIGLAEDNVELLQKMIEYLKKHKET